MHTWKLSRQGSATLNPATVVTHSSSFSVPATATDESSALFAVRTDAGLSGYFVAANTQQSNTAAKHLSQAVNAKLEADELPDFMARSAVIGVTEVEPDVPVYKDSQAGADPSETARVLATSMAPGSWVAASMRRPRKREVGHWRRWLTHRLNTPNPQHHSLSPQALVTSFFAGGHDKAEVMNILETLAADLPGFDMGVRVRTLSKSSVLANKILLMLAGVLLAVLGIVVPPFIVDLVDSATPITGSTQTQVIALATSFFVAVGALLVVAGALRIVFKIDSYHRALKQLAAGKLPQPGKAPFSVKAPSKERTVNERNTDSAGNVTINQKLVEAQPGTYPLNETAFMVAPHVLVGMVAPSAGVESGAMQTTERRIPTTMLNNIGPVIGYTADGDSVHISVQALLFFMSVFGDAGSGKSQLIRAIYGWFSLDKTLGSGVEGAPGRHNTLVAFENKGDGVGWYSQYAQLSGDTLHVFDVADPDSAAIDLFAVPGDAAKRAEFFVNAMQYAFKDGSIQAQSAETLRAVFTAALAMSVTPEVVERTEGRVTTSNPVELAHLLCGGRGDEVAVGLLGAMQQQVNAWASAKEPLDEATTVRHRDLMLGVQALQPLYGASTTSASRRSVTQAPRNKLDALLTCKWAFDPSKTTTTWRQIVTEHRSVLVNTGTTRRGNILEDETQGIMGSLLMFSLRNTIQRYCYNWLAEGRFVSVFADELSMLAGSSDEVIVWLRDQGRSSGVRAMFATQRPNKLSDSVRSSLMSYETLASFRQNDPSTAREVAVAVSSSEGEFKTEDITNLPLYTMIMRTSVDGMRQPASVIKPANFEADLSTFAEAQGFTDAPRITSPDMSGSVTDSTERYRPAPPPEPVTALAFDPYEQQ